MEREFGPYTLIKQIAVGGMAEIQLARTEGIAGFEKYVAIKMIHPNLSEDEQFIQMLIDEAKITVQLSHVNIAQTFDLGRVGKTYYITMEFIEGCDLYKLLRNGSEQEIDTPINVAAYIAKEAATGLDYAHRKRDVMGQPLHIVHRDVSPQNLLVSSVGEVKVIDFGIAKATMRSQHTEAGVIKGKYYYMSPEQSWGEHLDARTDIFSIGIILYELLTGQMLYLEEDLHTLLDMVREANIPPPTTLRRDIPPQLEAIVMKALQKRPNDRYSTAGEMASDLERFLHKHTPLFNAGTVSAWTEQVLANDLVLSTEHQMPERDRRAVTQGLGRERILSSDDEFNDENSIIFRVDEAEARLRAAELENEEERDIDQETGIVEPSIDTFDIPIPTLLEASDRDIGDSTKAISDLPPEVLPQPRSRPPSLHDNTPLPELYPEDEGGDRTIVSVAPGFESANLDDSPEFESATKSPSFLGAPTMVSALPGIPKITSPNTTAKRQPAAGPQTKLVPTSSDVSSFDDFDAEPTIAQSGVLGKFQEVTSLKPRDQSDVLEEIAGDNEPTMARAKASWQRSNALNDSNPKPAVSILKPPKKSRRTPPKGIPSQTPEESSSVLSTILTNPKRAQVALSETNHTHAAVPLATSQSASPIDLRAAEKKQPPPRTLVYQAPPSQLQPPPHNPMQKAAPWPPNPESFQGQGYPPQYAPNMGSAPPRSGGFPMVPGLATSAQLAMEVDELPDAYRLTGGSKRAAWILPTIGFLVLATAAAAAAYFLLTEKQPGGGQPATITVVSIPDDVSIRVNGTLLINKTPTTFEDATIGETYNFVMERKGYKRWEKQHKVTARRETLTARLEQILVTLTITSQPPGANVFLNGSKNQAGTTPLTLENMPPADVGKIDIAQEGYVPVGRTLDWTGTSTKTENFILKR